MPSRFGFETKKERQIRLAAEEEECDARFSEVAARIDEMVCDILTDYAKARLEEDVEEDSPKFKPPRLDRERRRWCVIPVLRGDAVNSGRHQNRTGPEYTARPATIGISYDSDPFGIGDEGESGSVSVHLTDIDKGGALTVDVSGDRGSGNIRRLLDVLAEETGLPVRDRS